MENVLMIIGLIITLALALLGWAYQLGFMGARVQRNERDIIELGRKQDAHAESLRIQMTTGFEKVYEKLDALPCHNPGWREDKCL